MGPLPGTKWDPSPGQTGHSLLNSTVKSPFCPVCPWDGWGFVIVKGRQKNVYVFSVYWFFLLPTFAIPKFLSCRTRLKLGGVQKVRARKEKKEILTTHTPLIKGMNLHPRIKGVGLE